ncbi:hypothetical protein AGMMS50212_16310 [Spirochaetia bacterium]|nr:hypothetical protein AGMMS50212_16310 [Spirochaetia bacterium]
MVYYNGVPIIEGIDKITLIIHPALRDFINEKYFEHTGKIPSIKLGNRTRVMENELNTFLKSCKTKIPKIQNK